MPTVEFNIGHKSYELACQEGEERLLRRAAAMLDTEARAILEQAGRMPEPRLLLLAGLMLADRMSATEDRAAAAERELGRLKAEEGKKLQGGFYINDKFLKMVQTPIPAYK